MLYDENVGLIRADESAFDSPAQVGVEYKSPEQRSGVYGLIYRQFFATTLPAELTSGDNVAKLIDYLVSYDNESVRGVAAGDTNYGGATYLRIQLSGISGNGNLVMATAGTWNIIEGWVDYTK